MDHLINALAGDKGIARSLEAAGVSSSALQKATSEIRKDKPASTATSDQNYDALSQYAVNLCERAREGKLDPVIGRDDEIRRCIQVRLSLPFVCVCAGTHDFCVCLCRHTRNRTRTCICQRPCLLLSDGISRVLPNVRAFSFLCAPTLTHTVIHPDHSHARAYAHTHIRTHAHTDSVTPHQEQPGARWRARCGQDSHRRGHGTAHRQRRCPRLASGRALVA